MTRADLPASLDEIDRIRAFNRFYTGRLGLLNRSYLESGLPLAEVRAVDAPVELGRLGLQEHLSAQRSNGLRAMVERIRLLAAPG